MRILVLWADPTSSNLGVQALAYGAERICRQAFGEATHVDFHDFGGGALGVPITGRPLVEDLLGRSDVSLREKLDGYDAVLNIGEGDSFSDIYGLRRAALMAAMHQKVERSSTLHLIGPQTIGPFETSVWRRLAVRTMRRAALVTARDSQSAEYATSLGIGGVTRATDLVFAMPAPAPAAQHDRVLVNVSGLLASDSPHVDAEAYRALMDDLVANLRSDGHVVALIAHVLDNPSADNDVRVGLELSETWGCGLVVPPTLDAARQEIAGSVGLVGSRMHACLNALSVGVPALPLAYSRKFAPLMADLGWAHTIDLRETEASGADLARKASALFAAGDCSEVAATARARLADYATDLVAAVA